MTRTPKDFLPKDFAYNHQLYNEWRKVWRLLLGLTSINPYAVAVESIPVQFSDITLKRFTEPPVLIAADSSSNSAYSSCVALVIKHGEQPWYHHDTIRGGDPGECELWGINSAVSAVIRRYGNAPKLVVFTDSIDLMLTRRKTTPISYKWLPRDHDLMRALNVAALILRDEQPVTVQERVRIESFMADRREKWMENLAAKQRQKIKTFVGQAKHRQAAMQKFMDEPPTPG